MEKLEKTASSFVSWHDLSFGLWALVISAGYGIMRFISWFATRELANFWNKIEKKILEGEGRIEKRLDVIEESITTYKKEKHEIANENAALKGTISLCNEALEKANKILSFDKALK